MQKSHRNRYHEMMHSKNAEVGGPYRRKIWENQNVKQGFILGDPEVTKFHTCITFTTMR